MNSIPFLSGCEYQLTSSAQKKEEIKIEKYNEPEIVTEQRIKTLRERSRKLYAEADKAHEEGKKEEEYCWKHAGWGLYKASERLKEAIQAEQRKESDIAAKWRTVGALEERSAEISTKSAQAHALEKGYEGQLWNDTANCLTQAADALRKAIKAEQKKEFQIATQWRIAAALHNRSTEFFTKAHAVIKEEEHLSWRKKTDASYSWMWAGNSLYFAAKSFEKAIFAEQSDKPQEAIKWREVAALEERSVEFYAKSAQAHASGKKSEGFSWGNGGIALCDIAFDLKQAIEAEQKNELKIAIRNCELAARQIPSVEFYTKSAQARAVEKEKEGLSWGRAGNMVHLNGWVSLSEAMEAEESNQPEIATKWREITALEERSREFYTKAAQVHGAGKEKEGDSWFKVGESLEFTTDGLSTAIKAEQHNQPELAIKWRTIADLYNCSVEPLTQAATAYAAEKEEEGNAWNNAGEGLSHAAKKLEKAINADQENKIEEAARLRAEVQEMKVNAELKLEQLKKK